MSTQPVRIRSDDKHHLEALRTEIQRTSGKRLSQQEVIATALDFVLRHRDQFLMETGWRPLSPAEIAFWTGKRHKLGTWTAEDIDKIVYGDEP